MVRVLSTAAFIILLSLTDANSAPWTRTTVPSKSPSDSQKIWLRCFVQVPDRLVTPEGRERDLWRSSTVLAIADLPGRFEIFLNGQSIIQSQGVPVGKEQRFKIPKDVLTKTQYNTLVIRIENKAAELGLASAPVLIDYFNELVLGNEWQFTTKNPAATEFAARQERPTEADY
jgi:hypothetical protein